MVRFASRCCESFSLLSSKGRRSLAGTSAPHTSSVSPTHRMTLSPLSNAAFVLLATNCPEFTNQQSSRTRIDSRSSSRWLPFISSLRPLSDTSRPLTLSSSPRMTLRSLCPTNTHPMPLSRICSALVSPVNAPFGLSKTFCAATSMPSRRCSRARRRYRAGGAMTTSSYPRISRHA